MSGGWPVWRYVSSKTQAAPEPHPWPLSVRRGEQGAMMVLCQDDALLAGEVAELAHEVLDDLFPGELASGTLALRANLRLLIGVLAHVQQVADDLVRIVGFERHGILERDSVVLAGRAGERDALGGHDLQPHQSKWLVAAVGQCRVGGGVAHTHKLGGHEEAQVVDIGIRRFAQQSQALLDAGPARFDVVDMQAKVAGAAEYLAAVWLDPAANDHRDGVPAILEVGGGFDSHQPALIGIEATNLEEEQAVGVASPQDITQLARCLSIHWL